MDVNKIFDAISNASRYVIQLDKIRIKKEKIKSVTEKRCGNCDLWMKSTCIPEKKYKQFKSMSSIACKDFKHNSFSIKLQQQYSDELLELEAKLKNI